MSNKENNDIDENIKINEEIQNQTKELENDSSQVPDNATSTKDNKIVQEEEQEEFETVLTLEQQKALQEEVSKLITDNKTLKDKLLRTHADYQNFRRRIQDDLNKRSEQGKFWLLSDLIISLDQLFIINTNWNPEDNKNFTAITKFFQTFQEDLEKIGFKKIQSIGKPLDLKYHEVVKSPENNSNDKLIIISEVQNGYTYKDRVIRPAMVELGVLEPEDKKP
ncbi:MAG: nucleotide exchange factor GrpE [Candidatus Hodarchaeales archaeon]